MGMFLYSPKALESTRTIGTSFLTLGSGSRVREGYSKPKEDREHELDID